MDQLAIYEQLITFIKPENIKPNEALKNYTHTKTGGHADFLLLPSTYEEAQKIVQFTYENNIPLTMLGNGSNLIVKDGGIRGIVLHLHHLSSIRLSDTKVIAQSGATIINTSRFALEHSLSGLEFSCGIPGSVGGALYMNAGAYGGEISDVLEETVVLTKEGQLLTLKREDLELTYRHSSIATNGYYVLEATFALKKENYDHIKSKMDELTFLRESKQPLEYPSCGSVFKRPPGLFAGKLIQDSGLQGKRIGGAEVSMKHAGFIVNVDNATATDYLKLIRFVQNTVKEKFNVELETEVKIIGEDLVTVNK